MATHTDDPITSTSARGLVLFGAAFVSGSALATALLVVGFVLYFSPQEGGQFASNPAVNAVLRFVYLFSRAFLVSAVTALLVAAMQTAMLHRGVRRRTSAPISCIVAAVLGFVVSLAWVGQMRDAGMFPLLSILACGYTLLISVSSSVLAVPLARRAKLSFSLVAGTLLVVVLGLIGI